MPNIKSAKKRVKVIETKTLQNKMFKSQLRTIIKKFNAAVARHPMKRMADPDEIASICEFLCTDDSAWVTGQTIVASGGALTL